MRCNNCGYDNAPGSASCVKCGHPLQSENAGYDYNGNQNVREPNYNRGEAQPRPTVINAPRVETAPRPTVADVRQAASMPRPTRIDNGPMLKQENPMGKNEPQAPQRCSYCGYPVMGNFSSCPNCGGNLTKTSEQPSVPGQPAIPEQQPAKTRKSASATEARPSVDTELDIAEEVKCDKCGTMVSIDYKFCPTCGERIHLPTMRVVRHKAAPAPHCHLTLIPEEEENATPVKHDYEGASVILNRENTEPGNRTITSKEQAELSFEDGKWFLLNKSELQSTYLEVNRKLELQPGDIVVLGDRRFKFETDDTDK